MIRDHQGGVQPRVSKVKAKTYHVTEPLVLVLGGVDRLPDTEIRQDRLPGYEGILSWAANDVFMRGADLGDVPGHGRVVKILPDVVVHTAGHAYIETTEHALSKDTYCPRRTICRL